MDIKEQLQKKPPDIDIRILLPANTHYSREYFTLIGKFFIQYMAQGTYGGARVARNKGFDKFKIAYDGNNRFFIASFGNGEQKIEIVVVDYLQREHLFLAGDLSLSIRPYFSPPNTQIAPSGRYENGFQAILDLLTQTLHVDKPAEVDNGWPRLFSFLMKGWVWTDPSLESTFLQSIRREATKKKEGIVYNH